MEIIWFGISCFQLKGKNVTLITDPFDPRPGYSLGKVSASIVTVSHEHTGHSYVQSVGGNPRVVRGPGEYEISDILITGVPSYHDDKRGQERGRNTVYVIHMDDMVICHLGDLGHTLQEEQLEEVADADILLIPIGGHNTINATQAAEVISQVEPHIIIPMHYETLEPLVKFGLEMGIEEIIAKPKLIVTRNNLPAETQVVILEH